MPAKPADYFVGLHDFFALLLPGALLTFWLSPAMLQALEGLELRSRITSGAGGWIAFLLASFFVGQVLFSVAATLDWIGDRFADRRVLASETAVQAEVPGLPRGKLRHVGAAWLRVNCPNAMPEIDRLVALCKFYRSLAVVLVVAALGYFGRSKGLDGVSRLEWSWGSSSWILVTVGSMLVAFTAYLFYRVRHREAVVLYLQLASPPSWGPPPRISPEASGAPEVVAGTLA